MSTPAVAVQNGAAIMEEVIAKGDLKNLSAEDRSAYYMRTCESLGINPLSKPFDFITLNGRLTLYATRTATDQLRSLRNVSVEIVERETVNDLHIVTARATMPDGRSDMEIGAVNIAGLKGDGLANAYMKAMTKAKRRVTLSICGLGWLDESEVETVPSARAVSVDTETGEIIDTERASATSDATPRANDAQRAGDGAKAPDATQHRKAFFAAITARGVTDPSQQKALCTHIFPGVESRREYTAAMWADATAWVEDEANASAVKQFAARDWPAAIGSAKTIPDLETIAAAMVNANAGTDLLRTIYRERREELSQQAG